ncbi:MAG: glycine cleavage system protein GcvH, partial [Bacteroidetes bacterium]|nr:glycine cleavage system protein GcvH [Bacteroidota bacterium]
VGINDFAQVEREDIVYIEIDKLDADVEQNKVFGTVEAVKTVSELYMPVSGTLVEFNEDLEDSPEQVNDDPYGEGWLIKIRMSDPSQVSDLLSADEYAELVAA